MKKSVMLAAVIVAGLITAPAFAATKTYQVTGPVVDMSPGTITVQKGSEKWEIACGTACAPDVKVGSKVTVQYTMTAESVMEKPAAAPKAMKPTASSTGTITAPAMQPAMATGTGTTPTANK